MDNFMIDLETLGTHPYSIILSLGAIQFDFTGKKGAQFYATIDQQSCRDAGLTHDDATVAWWNKQNASVIAALHKDNLPLIVVLKMFSTWIKKQCPDTKYMWGNSAAFDLGLLGQAYERCNLASPWEYWNERCVRTIVALAPKVKDSMPKPTGTHHPIVDCNYQIDYMCKTLKTVLK